MRIGLMGGTFDPIHYGHLFIAEESRVRFGLEKVIFFPNHKPAHRQGKVASADAEQRYALTVAAVEGNPRFEVSRIEIDRLGPSFAYDTVIEFIELFGKECELYFIVGADSINEILTWYRGAELFKLCRFAVARRPGFDSNAALAALTTEQLKRVEFLDAPGIDIASSVLRQRIKAGKPVRYLLPEPVEAEIVRLGLYGAEEKRRSEQGVL